MRYHGIRPHHALPAMYCIAFGVYGTLLPFLPLILREGGLSDVDVSLALSAMGLAAIVSPMLMAYFADAKYPLRRILTAMFLFAAALNPLWLVVSDVFGAFCLTFAIFGVFIPALSCLDAFTIKLTQIAHHADSVGTKATFQGIRRWGSFGFIIPTVIFALYESGQEATGTLIFIGTILTLASALIALLLPHNAPVTAGKNAPSIAALKFAFSSSLRSIIYGTGLAGIALSIFFVVFPRYLQELGASPSTIGLITVIGVLWEMLLFPYAQRLVARFGIHRVILIGVLSLPLRLIPLALYPSLHLAVALQFLHAPVIVAMMLCVPMLLGECSEERFRFSLQGIYTVISFGIARLLGPIIVAPILSYFAETPLLALRIVLVIGGIIAGLGALLLVSPTNRLKYTLNIRGISKVR